MALKDPSSRATAKTTVLAAFVLAAVAAFSPPATADEKAPAASAATLTLDEIRAQLASGNAEAAVEQLRLLARENNAQAQVLLGDLHMKGQGVLHNFSLGANWYQRAADAGDAEAEYKLGRLFQRGEGVILYLGRARDLFAKAAQQGHQGAAEALKEMGAAPPGLKPPRVKMAAAKGDMKGDAKAGTKDKAGVAKAVTDKVGQKIAQVEARLTNLMKRSAGAGPMLAVGLFGAEPPAPGAVPDPKLLELVGRYAAAVKARDLKALKALMGPEYAACATDKNRQAYDAYLADGLAFDIAPGYGVRMGALKPETPLPFPGLVTYPVRPSHYVLIEGKGKASAAAGQVDLPPLVVQPVVNLKGEWSLVFGCPAGAGSPAAPKPKPAQPTAKKADV